MSPSDQSEQNVANPENSIEFECGVQTLVVQTHKQPEELRKHLEKLETETRFIGCNSLSPSDQSEQNVANPENSNEFECGVQTLVVQTDKQPEELRKHLEKLETETRFIGCSSLSPSDQSEQNVANPENSIEIEYGAQILVVYTDKLPEEQRKHLKKLETRGRIDNAARKLDIPRGIDTVKYGERQGLRCDEDCENNYPNRRR